MAEPNRVTRRGFLGLVAAAAAFAVLGPVRLAAAAVRRKPAGPPPWRRVPDPKTAYPEGTYLLEVEGDGMRDAGILPGDYVIVRHGHNADPGNIVVALVEQWEAMLAYYHPEREGARLVLANARYDDVFRAWGKIELRGVVVGVIRHFPEAPPLGGIPRGLPFDSPLILG